MTLVIGAEQLKDNDGNKEDLKEDTASAFAGAYTTAAATTINSYFVSNGCAQIPNISPRIETGCPN